MSEKFRILARHKWVAGATITESVQRRETLDEACIHRFTATVRGYQNWKIYQGPPSPSGTDYVIATVKEIRDRIDAGDEAVFSEPNEYATAEEVTG